MKIWGFSEVFSWAISSFEMFLNVMRHSLTLLRVLRVVRRS